MRELPHAQSRLADVLCDSAPRVCRHGDIECGHSDDRCEREHVVRSIPRDGCPLVHVEGRLPEGEYGLAHVLSDGTPGSDVHEATIRNPEEPKSAKYGVNIEAIGRASASCRRPYHGEYHERTHPHGAATYGGKLSFLHPKRRHWIDRRRWIHRKHSEVSLPASSLAAGR